MLGNHLFGIYEKALPKELSWAERLEKYREIGFDYMEISIDEDPDRVDRLFRPASETEQMRRISYEEGLPIKTMCLSGHRKYPLGSPDSAGQEKARELLLRAIDFSLRLGISVIQLAGYDAYYGPSTPESVEMFGRTLEWASEQAEKYQVMLAMEIMDTEFMNSVSKHMVYETAVHSPWYKLYPDLGNLSAWPENNVRKELEMGVHSMVAVHVKDTLAAEEDRPGTFKNIPFGTGCVDFAGCFRTLENLNYKGPYMMEMWAGSRDSEREEQVVRKAKAFIEDQFEKAETGGES